MHRRVRLLGAGLACAVFVVGCSSDSSTGGDGDIDRSLVLEILTGNAQSAVVGSAVGTKPAVKVTHDDGSPAANVAVTFAVGSGGGSVTGASQTTDASGVATVGGWTLGTTAGANNLTANVADASPASVTFTATGTAGAAAQIAKTAGDGLNSAAGVAVATKPAVRVTDMYGNGVADVAVVFAVASGGGVVNGASQTTGADGTATVGGWILGTHVGENTLTATANGTAIANNVVTFTADAIAGPVASLTKIAGDNLTAQISSALATPPSVRAADLYGNLIAGLGVTFAVASGGGTATGTNATTDAAGVATAGSWTLGSAPGTNTMTATAQGVTVTFTATALAAFNAAQYAGTYTGSWTNTMFGSTGQGSALVAVNEANKTATVTVNVTGSVLGTGNGVTNSVNNGAYTDNGATFNGNVAPMGNITATLGADGSITASGTNPTNPAIAGWTATGTLTPTALNMTFVVTFADQSTAVGTITLNKN